MGRYVKKGLRGNWSQQDLQNAINAIANGKKINTTAKEFKVPRRTLKRYIAERKTMKSCLGRKPLLSAAQEVELKARIKRLASVGYPITPKLLRLSVYRYCRLNSIRIPSQTEDKGQVGHDWIAGFMQRHPDLSMRKSQKLNPARAQKLNKFVVKDYFEKLKETMVKLDVQDKPAQIYNIDEKGCQLMLHKSPQVLAQKGIKRVHILAPEHAQNVTIVACANAMGNTIPPMILFKGKRMKPEWQDNLPPGSLVAMTPKGSMNTETFVKWITHFAKFKSPGPCLLIFDGAACHLDYDIVDIADKHEITLFCLPSNTTHELQPLDKAVFRAFEHFWDQELQKFWFQNKDKALTKQRFGVIFTPVWDKALTPSNIKSGFEATGIYPFNPDRIPECAYAPSIPTHLPESGDCNVEDTANIDAVSDLNDDSFDSEDAIPLSLLQNNERVHDKSPGLSTSPATLESRHVNSEHVVPGPSAVSTSLAVVGSRSVNPPERDIPGPSALSSSLAVVESRCLILPECNVTEPSTSSSRLRSGNIDHESNVSFADMMKTPEKVSSNKSPRRKAINSLAQHLTKPMFAKKTPLAPSTQMAAKITHSRQKKKSHATKHSQSWYCFLCKEDKVADMRLCSCCGAYVHEECVGLTASDKEVYICPKCEK